MHSPTFLALAIFIDDEVTKFAGHTIVSGDLSPVTLREHLEMVLPKFFEPVEDIEIEPDLSKDY